MPRTSPAEPPPDHTPHPVLFDPVPLHVTETCVAQRHQNRIWNAFLRKGTPTYEEMRDRLTSLRYPAARIHRMPDFSGKPVARLDLRMGAGHLALEVTGLNNLAMVRAFGAPVGVSVTEVRLMRELSRPTT